MLHKVELLPYGVYYIDDPLPYAISILERYHVVQHDLPHDSWAPAQEITSHIIEQTLNAISHHGNGRHLTRLNQLTEAVNNNENSQLIALVSKRHPAIRYSTICPRELVSYIELEPPRFPRIMIGRQRRYEFFKKSSIPLQTMNALVNEIQLEINKKQSSVHTYRSTTNKLIKLQEAFQQHKDFFEDIRIKNTWFNRIFRRKTLGFQSAWESALVGANNKVSEIKLDLAAKLLMDAFNIRKNYIKQESSLDLEYFDAIDAALKTLMESSVFDFSATCTTGLSDRLDARYQDIKSKYSYLSSLSLPILTQEDIPDATRTLSLCDKIVNLIKSQQITSARNIIEFCRYRHRVMGEPRTAFSLVEIEKLQQVMIENMDGVFEVNSNLEEPFQDLIFTFDQLVDGDTHTHKTSSKLQVIWQEKVDTSAAINITLKNISQSIIGYIKNKTWNWPVDSHYEKIIIQAQPSIIQAQLKKRANRDNFPLIASIKELIKQSQASSEKTIIPVLQALVDFLSLNFSAYQKALPAVKDVELPNHKDSVSIPGAQRGYDRFF